MIFDELIQKKLASLLRPWLAQEPEWEEVKLGFRRSLAVAKNLLFDSSALNRLLSGGDGGESRLSFESVTIDEVSFRVSHWSSPAFSLDVRGLHVTLFPQKPGQLGVPVEDYLEERKKKILAQIDPGGSMLHDSMEKIMMTAFSKRGLKDSIINLVLAHCCLHLHDARVRVKCPVFDDNFSWFCYMREVNAESPSLGIGNFFGGFVWLLFRPLREANFDLQADGLEIGAEKQEHKSCIISCVNPCVGIRLKDLELVNFELSVPEMNFSFCPDRFQMMGAFRNLFYVGYRRIRSGRLLWGIARSKICLFLQPPGRLLYRVIVVAILWLRLVKEYQHFMEFVGCSDERKEILDGRNFARLAKQNWKTVSKIEKELPAEAIATARRVARYKEAEPHAKHTAVSARSSHSKSFWRVFLPLAVIWGAILRIFKFILAVFHLHQNSPKILFGYPGMTSGASNSRCCFHLSCGKISTVISSPDARRHTVPGISNLRSRNKIEDLSSFCLLVNGLSFLYEEGRAEQHMSFVVGSLEGTSLLNFGALEKQNSSRNVGGILEGRGKERLDDSETIMWGEPVLMCPASEDGEAVKAAIPFLSKLSGEMELIWKRLQLRSQGSRNHYEGNPWAVSEIHWMYPGLKSLDSVTSKCNLMVGKLNFAVGYSSVFSIATLIGQMQNAFYQFDGSESSVVVLPSSGTLQDSQEQIWSRKLKSCVKALSMKLFKLLPCEHIELGATVAGPRVQISLRNEETSISNVERNATDDSAGVHIVLDVHDSDFAVWPTAKSGVSSCKEFRRADDSDSQLLNGFSELGNMDYASKGQISLDYDFRFGGLSAYLEDQVENHMMQFLLLKPVTAKVTSLRDYLHSFSRSVVASSLSLCGAMTGVAGLFYMDEMSVVLQVVERLFSAVSETGAYFSSSMAQNCQTRADHPIPSAGPTIEETKVGINEGVALGFEDAFFSVNGSFELGPFDIVFHSSRNGVDKRGCSMIFDAYNIRKLDLANLPQSGIWLSVQKACIYASVENAKAEIQTNLSGFHTVIFVAKDQIANADLSNFADTVLQSVDCLQEVSLSTCTIFVLVNCKDDLESLDGADCVVSRNSTKDLLSTFSSKVDSERLNAKLIQENDFGSNESAVSPSPWLLMSSTIDVIFMGACSVKNGVLGAHPGNQLRLSLSIGGDLRSICLWSQGGLIFVETLALGRFSDCFTSYLHCIRSLSYLEHPHMKSMRIPEPGEKVSILGEGHIQEPTQSQRNARSVYPVKGELWEAFNVTLSQFSLVLLAIDESGLVKEVIGKVGFSMKLWLENQRKFLFNLFYLDILSQNLDGGMAKPEESIQIPHFSSGRSSYGSSWLNTEDSSDAVLHMGNSFVLRKNASCSSPSTSLEISSANDTTPTFLPESERDGSFILEQFSIAISAEKPFSLDENAQDCTSQGWHGSGSVSGLNLTISLSEIQMLTTIMDSLYEVSGKDAVSDVTNGNWLSINQDVENLESAVPDGAVVAIQDVHQHMYVTVESVENKFKLAGAVHYSLAGKRALFRVKWQKRRWNFSASWFSLMSLYAKSDSGEPLCLSYSASSGFVDISSKKDSASALWKIASCKHENYEDDADLEPLNRLSSHSFYLVNKKSDCGAAFIDGAFEFVKKPGNQFKFKVFHDLRMDQVAVISGSHLPESHTLGPLDGQNISDQLGSAPCITLTIEKISLTIVHEISDAKDKFPLLQGCINSTEVNVQILPRKTRVMSTLTAVLYYFDVHRVIWRELVHPIEICFYCRTRSMGRSQVTETSNHGMHSRLYVGVKELESSFTELSLDILLYVIGRLDLAGPFAVKSSAILANCCKVENQSEVYLLCDFYDAQSARVGRRQSAFFFLRHLVDPLSEASYATFRLESPETSSTSSIHVSLAETRIFAWRTRIMSSRDPRTSPGPFIVFDISRNVEEGLSITVSPLLRICNETGFPVELRIQRPEQMEAESASVLLRQGETVDDCMAAFDANNLFGGPKKALLSLGVGNFIFSFRPETKGVENNSGRSYLVEWSDNLKGGKAVRLSGVIDKLSYQVRKAFSANSWKYSFSMASCSVAYGNAHEAKMHFLIQSIGRDVPIIQPNGHPKSKNSSIALQEQKEIYLLPTVRVSNLLESDIDVLLTETENPLTDGLKSINQATISCGLTVDLYANPAIIYFTIKLLMFDSSCKPVNCGQCLKKLNKRKDGIQFLDVDLEFCSGKYFACLRLARGHRGILEAIIFTQYTLRNDTDFPLFFAAPHMKSLSRDEAERYATTTSPHLGSFLPPKSTRSWFMKSSKLRVKLLDEETAESILDLDALSGLAEISFMKIQASGSKHLVKLGVSLGPLASEISVPSRVVCIVPRYVISNESDKQIFVRQCYVEDDSDGTIKINSKQKAALFLRIQYGDKRDVTVFDKLMRKHKISEGEASSFVQFRPDEIGVGWSGPVSVASLGRFFLKFRRSIPSSVYQSDFATTQELTTPELAAVHVVEEASSFVLRFHKPPNIDLPYRIVNDLRSASITYYQKVLSCLHQQLKRDCMMFIASGYLTVGILQETFEPETLASGGTVNYVWDDLTQPHKLMVKINGKFHPQMELRYINLPHSMSKHDISSACDFLGINVLREISLDKLRSWKPFFRVRQQRELASDLPIDNRIADRRRTNPVQTNGIAVENIGYEVYAEGPTRVLRICDSSGSCKGQSIFQSCKKIQLRISSFAIHLLEHCKQDFTKDVDSSDLSTYTPVIVGRLQNISLDCVFIDQQKYNQIKVQEMNIDEKWVGAPFAAVLRRHLTSGNVTADYFLFVVFVLYPSSSRVREVKYSSIVIQPIDLNIDEETLMKIVPFWRSSLSSNTQSQQYYFDHFEVHPIKIIANFLPDDSYSSYSSGQETVRSLLHSVIKIPTIKNLEVELNGVLVTHALVTTRELVVKCAQHYSWYAMRAIYIAKGSKLLPPTFASVFDDLASSSLDVFFDPSSSLFNVRGLTLGTFKLVSKCIQDKGISGTKRYFGDLSKTLKNAGSNILFAAVTEVSDSVLKGAESSGLNGMVTGFHHGILKLAMEPSLLGTAFMEGGPDRKITLDRSPGVDELYIEGYLQAMLDTIYKQDYLRVRVIDNQVILKNLPPNSSLISEIMDRVKEFLVSKSLLKGDLSTSSRPLRHLRGDHEWRIGPTVLTLCEHLLVSFAIRILRKLTDNALGKIKLKEKWVGKREEGQSSSSLDVTTEKPKGKGIWRWGIGRFVLSAMVAYVDGRLCRCIPNPVARRIVSGFLLSFLDNKDSA